MKKVLLFLVSLFAMTSAMAETFTLTSEDIINGGTGTVQLATTSYKNGTAEQLVADPSTWYTFSAGGYDFTGCRICKAGANNLGHLQVQGNASAVASQGFIGNTTSFGKVTGVKVYTIAGQTSALPQFNVYLGTEALGQNVKLDKTFELTEKNTTNQYWTFTCDFSNVEGDYGFVKVYNDLANVLTVVKVEIDYESESAATPWEGTVTTTLDDVTMHSVSEFEGITLKFAGAQSIALNSIEEDGETLYGSFEAWNPDFSEYYIWSPYYGSEAVINGDEVTLNGWIDAASLIGGIDPLKAKHAKKVAEGDTDYQFEMMDYGETFIINGQVYEPQIDLFFNAEKTAAVEPFDLTVINGKDENALEAGSTADKLSWYFYTTLPEGFELNRELQATLYKDNEMFSVASAGMVDATTAYFSFRNAAPDYIEEVGQYTLSIPEGIFTVAGVPNAEYVGKWAVLEKAPKTPFDVEVKMNLMGESIASGAEVSALSYMYEIVTDKQLSAGDGRIEFKDATGAGIGVGELFYNYIRFMNFGQDGYKTPGTYTLTIPAGALVDEDGNPCNAYTATWTVVAPEAEVLNIENATVGTVVDDTYGFEDTKYTITLDVPVPAGAAYAYCEGIHVSLNGVDSNVPFSAGQWGMITLTGENPAQITFTDGMMAKTTDPDWSDDFRAPGTYVATAEIYFMDADQLELTTSAKYTGTVVLPNLNEEPATTKAIITAHGTTDKQVVENAHIDDAYTFVVDFQGKNYMNATCMVNKLTWNEPDPDWGMDGYYMEEEVDRKSFVNNGDGTWTATFVNQPQHFENGVLYEVRVRAWEGAMFDENWSMQPYDETYIQFYGGGEAQPEPIELVMGAPEYTTFDAPVPTDKFEGITVSYPDNNIDEACADLPGYEYHAIALICESAAIYECDADGSILDFDNPIAEEHFASNFDYESVDLFTTNVTLEPNKHYVAVINGMTLQDQSNYDDPYLWVQGPWDAIWVYFETTTATGINGIAVDKNAVKFNIAGQRVGNDAKGIIIVNGKKIVKK